MHFIQASKQEFIQWAATTSNQTVADDAHVVTDVTSTLGFAARIRCEVSALLLGGVRELLIYCVGCTIDQFLGIGGQSASSFHSGSSTLVTTIDLVHFSIAQETTLSIGSCDRFSNGGFHR